MDRCDTATPVGVVLNGGSTNLAQPRVNFGGNVPTVSVAVKIEQFSFVFVATDDMSIRGVSAWCSQLVCTLIEILISTV